MGDRLEVAVAIARVCSFLVNDFNAFGDVVKAMIESRRDPLPILLEQEAFDVPQ